jgi:hypothetical protein
MPIAVGEHLAWWKSADIASGARGATVPLKILSQTNIATGAEAKSDQP